MTTLRSSRAAFKIRRVFRNAIPTRNMGLQQAAGGIEHVEELEIPGRNPRKKVLGPGHTETLISIVSLAHSREDQRKHYRHAAIMFQ